MIEDEEDYPAFQTYDRTCLTCDAWDRLTQECAIKGRKTQPTDSCGAHAGRKTNEG